MDKQRRHTVALASVIWRTQQGRKRLSVSATGSFGGPHFARNVDPRLPLHNRSGLRGWQLAVSRDLAQTQRSAASKRETAVHSRERAPCACQVGR